MADRGTRVANREQRAAEQQAAAEVQRAARETAAAEQAAEQAAARRRAKDRERKRASRAAERASMPPRRRGPQPGPDSATRRPHRRTNKPPGRRPTVGTKEEDTVVVELGARSASGRLRRAWRPRQQAATDPYEYDMREHFARGVAAGASREYHATLAAPTAKLACAQAAFDDANSRVRPCARKLDAARRKLATARDKLTTARHAACATAMRRMSWLAATVRLDTFVGDAATGLDALAASKYLLPDATLRESLVAWLASERATDAHKREQAAHRAAKRQRALEEGERKAAETEGRVRALEAHLHAHSDAVRSALGHLPAGYVPDWSVDCALATATRGPLAAVRDAWHAPVETRTELRRAVRAHMGWTG